MAKLDRPLSEKEIDQLAAFVDRVDSGDLPDIEAVDGFLTALVVGPGFVPPSEFLAVIRRGADEDGDLVFDDLDEATVFFGLVMRHWNGISASYAKGGFHSPILLEDRDGMARGNAWAKGFLRGMQMDRPLWAPVVEDEERSGPFVPILALAYENDPNPELRPFEESLTPDKRSDLIVAMIAGTMHIYEIFAEERRLTAQPELPRKVGRNEPCPCGSGKKYKKCCALATFQ